MLGGGNTTPLAYVIVGAILLLFAVGYVAYSWYSARQARGRRLDDADRGIVDRGKLAAAD